MTYSPGEALRTIGWSSPYHFDSFTPEIDPIRDYIAILGPAEVARRMQIEEQELNQFLTAGEAPSAYVGLALLGLQRRWQHQKVTWRSELRRPENLQLRARMGNGRGDTRPALH